MIKPIKNNKSVIMNINGPNYVTNGIGNATTVEKNDAKQSTPKD
jgi:hypothetical protein